MISDEQEIIIDNGEWTIDFLTEYWLNLLTATDYGIKEELMSVLNDCKELNKILSSIVKTTKNKLA